MYNYIPLTLTFKEQITMSTAKKRLLKRLYRIVNLNIKFNFCIEIGKQYNVHFHGYIEYPTTLVGEFQRFLSVWKRYEGFYYISNLKDKELSAIRVIDNVLCNVYKVEQPFVVDPKIIWHLYCHKDNWIHNYQLNNSTYALTYYEQNMCVKNSTGKDLLKYVSFNPSLSTKQARRTGEDVVRGEMPLEWF